MVELARRCVLLLVILVCAPAAGQSHDVKVALVIGNATYPAAPLVNTVKDAEAIAKMLTGLGFDVTTATNTRRSDLLAAIDGLKARINDKTSVVLVYYAGHGVQLDGANYFIPVDASLASKRTLRAEAIEVSRVLGALGRPEHSTLIVILDSCRDNPFRESGAPAGLAQMDAPAGTFIAFATAPGNVASDGAAAQGHGVYTQALLDQLRTPAGSIESVFKRVRYSVRQKTNGRQIPWESTSLEREFYFVTPASDRTNEIEAFRDEVKYWNSIADSQEANVFYTYMQRYPTGYFAERAQAQIERLAADAPVRPIGRQRRVVVPIDRPLFALGDRFVYRSSDAYGKALPTRDLRVTRVAQDTVELNEGAEVWDWIGNLIVDQVSGRIVRSPAKLWVPSELYVGKRWRTAYATTSRSGGGEVFWDFVIDALESLRLPAGDFEAFRVTGRSETASGATQTETLWIDSKSYLIVKDVWQRKRSGRIEASYSRELQSLERSERR